MSTVSDPIGGFLGFELPSLIGELPPSDASLFGSGRACLRAILEVSRPKRLLVPFYICDSAFSPAEALGVSVVFYAIDEGLRPRLPAIEEGDLVLVVDYFGLRSDVAFALEPLSHRLVVDQTQALFAAGPPSVWRFTSARKWFGVPDGGFLRGPWSVSSPPWARLQGAPAHLIERSWGDPARAYATYLEAERRIEPTVSPISEVSVALLRGVDAELVRRRRRSNFETLHARLDGLNALEVELHPLDVPFCYPFLPEWSVPRDRLAKEGLFIPQFWADCLRRSDSDFAYERMLAERLLPLPVDHRYDERDMLRMVERLIALRDAR